MIIMLPDVGVSTSYRGAICICAPRPGHRHAVGKKIVDGLDMEGFLDFGVGRDQEMQEDERR